MSEFNTYSKNSPVAKRAQRGDHSADSGRHPQRRYKRNKIARAVDQTRNPRIATNPNVTHSPALIASGPKSISIQRVNTIAVIVIAQRPRRNLAGIWVLYWRAHEPPHKSHRLPWDYPVDGQSQVRKRVSFSAVCAELEACRGAEDLPPTFNAPQSTFADDDC